MTRFHLAQMPSNRTNNFYVLSQMVPWFIRNTLFSGYFFICQRMANEPNPNQ